MSFCAKCGNKIGKDDGFCAICGAPIRIRPNIQDPKKSKDIFNHEEMLNGEDVTRESEKQGGKKMANPNPSNVSEQLKSATSFAGLGMDKNTRAVKTEEFTIEGHLLKWKDTAIQIDNVSLVTIGTERIPNLPIWVPSVITLGIVLMLIGGSRYSNGLTIVQEIGLMCTAVGIGIAVVWAFIARELNKHKYLHFLLNSGITYSIEFTDFNFLQTVMQVFEEIFRNGFDGGTYYYFDLKNSHISQSQIGGKIQN